MKITRNKVLLIWLVFSICFSGVFGVSKGPIYTGNKYHFEEITDSVIVKEKKISVNFFNGQCGGYGFFWFVIPFIPVWDNINCDNIIIGVNKVSKIYIKHNDKTYDAIKFNSEQLYYTFQINAKSLQDGGILVIEKDGEKFELPFKYQHTFGFGFLFGRN